MTNKKKEFLSKLQQLMNEYDVTISFSVGSCSDTHGLYDEKMVVSHRSSPNHWKEETWLEVEGWTVSAMDITETTV